MVGSVKHCPALPETEECLSSMSPFLGSSPPHPTILSPFFSYLSCVLFSLVITSGVSMPLLRG